MFRVLMIYAAIFGLIQVSHGAEAADGRSTYPPVAKTMTKSEMAPHVGIITGLTNPENFKSTTEYGVDVGFQPWTPLSLGLEWTGANTNRRLAGTKESLDRTNVLLKAAYNLGGETPVVRHSYLGVALGPVIDNRAYRGTHSGIGPVAGFDIPVTKEQRESQALTLGLAAKYIFVSGPSPDGFSMNGALKYWF